MAVMKLYIYFYIFSPNATGCKLSRQTRNSKEKKKTLRMEYQLTEHNIYCIILLFKTSNSKWNQMHYTKQVFQIVVCYYFVFFYPLLLKCFNFIQSDYIRSQERVAACSFAYFLACSKSENVHTVHIIYIIILYIAEIVSILCYSKHSHFSSAIN